MKINIPLLKAGRYISYETNYTKFVEPNNEKTSNKTEPGVEKESKLLPDSTLNELLLQGNPNDVSYFYNAVRKFDKETEWNNGKINTSRQKDLLELANRVLFNAKKLDKAEERAFLNGSLDDIAVDLGGNMYVYDKLGKILTIHMSKFNPKKYHALTVSELIELRRENPLLTFDPSTVTTISQTIGTEKIVNFIQGLVDKIGSSETKQEAFTTAKEYLKNIALSLGENPSETEIVRAAEKIKDLTPLILDGLLKIDNYVKDSNVEQGLNYIIRALPTNMRNQLIANAIAKGVPYESAVKQPDILIASAIDFSRDFKQELNIDIKSGISGSGSNKEKNEHLSILSETFSGMLGPKTVIIRSPNDKNILVLAKGNSWGTGFFTGDNKNIQKGPLGDILNATIAPLLDLSNVLLGKEISRTKAASRKNELNDFVFDNSEVDFIYLPVTSEGLIDWNQIDARANAEEEIDLEESKGKRLTTQDKNRIHTKHHSQYQYTEDGHLISRGGSEKRFMYTTVITMSEGGYRGLNPMAEKLEGENEEAAKRVIESAYGNKKLAKAAGKQTEINNEPGTGWFTELINLEELYRIPIFIEVRDNAERLSLSMTNRGAVIPLQTIDQLATRELIANGSRTINASSDLL